MGDNGRGLGLDPPNRAHPWGYSMVSRRVFFQRMAGSAWLLARTGSGRGPDGVWKSGRSGDGFRGAPPRPLRGPFPSAEEPPQHQPRVGVPHAGLGRPVPSTRPVRRLPRGGGAATGRLGGPLGGRPPTGPASPPGAEHRAPFRRPSALRRGAARGAGATQSGARRRLSRRLSGGSRPLLRWARGWPGGRAAGAGQLRGAEDGAAGAAASGASAAPSLPHGHHHQQLLHRQPVGQLQHSRLRQGVPADPAWTPHGDRDRECPQGGGGHGGAGRGGARRGGGAAARPRALSSGFRVAAEEGSRCCLEVGLFPLGSSSPDAASRGPYRQVKRREKAWKQRPGPGGGHSTPASKLSTAAKVIQGTCGLFSLPQRLRYHHLL